MPKNKFNGFYYGVGMKLDEASIDKAGQQLEGRLNKVVDNITQKVATMSDAIAKGSKNVDVKDLVKSLAEAQKELNQFQNFDPSKLQRQIDSLNSTVTSLGNNLGDIGAQLKNFTNDVSTRLSNIEIKTSKQGKDALKADLKGIIELARGYRDVMSQGVDIDTSALDKYFLKVKQGFKSLQNSQNPMEMFTDKELAHYFISFTKILQEMGAPVDKLRSEFYSLSSVFKSTFEKSGASGATSVFKDISYQIETVSAKIRKAEADLERYEASIARAQSRTKSTGFDITVDGDKNLSFEQKIARIQEYSDIICELDYGEEWATATKHQIALIQAAEKELSAALKKPQGQEMLAKWMGAFGKIDLENEDINRESVKALSEYIDFAQNQLKKLQTLHAKTKSDLETYNADLGKLMAKEAITTSSKKTNKPTHFVQKQKATGVAAEVDAKIKINQEEWRKAINKAITDVEPKVKPFKIRVEATSSKILEEVKKIRDAALVNKGKDGTSDVNAFNKRFDTFYTNLKKRREEIIDELKTNWHPALKDAFSFKFELLGIDKRSLTKDIDTYLISTVDAINDALAQKPIEFHSNIDKLIDEIQSKIENLKIDGNITLGAGNVTVNPSSIGNVPLILGNIQPGNVVQSQPISTPELPKQEPKPTEDKKSKKISKKTQKTGESLEDILDVQFKNGKEIIEHYIGIAKLGKNLSSIREIADKRITADMFNDENLTKWVRGKMYTKDDIGSYAPGKKATPEALDKFLSTMGITEADLAAANTKEETEFLTPLKKYIYTFMQNRQELNSLIQELTDGQNKASQGVAHGYLNAGDDTTKYLVDEVFDVVKKLYVKDPKTRAQQLVTNAFKNAHIDLSAMSAMKTTEDKWNLLQSQLFNRKNYMLGSGDAAFATDWENFAKIFSTSGLGANLDKLSALLKIGRQYSTTSNALSAVGKEADLLIKGRTEEIEKRSRRWNNTIGDYEYTEEKVSQVVQQGVRGMLKGLKAVFENKAGNTLLGYNLGKGYIPDDVYQSPNSSYTQIIKALTTATQNSSKILFDRRMKGLEGNTSVGRYDPPTNRVASGQYKFATQHTEKEQITKWISEINKQKAQLQSELGEINKQYAKLVKPEDKDRVVKLVSEIKTKKENLNQYNDKIVAEKNKIDELKKSLASPEAIYEDIVEKLLQAEENLINLKKELASKKKQQKPGTYNKEIEDLQAKISAQETSIKSLTASADVASRSNSEESANRLIAQEEEKIRILNEKLAVQKENQSVKQKQEEINKLKSEQAALVERINVLREESKKVQDIINKSTSQGAIAAMTTALQAKTNEIDGLLQKTTAYQSQIDSLQAEIDPHNAEKSFLSKEIEFRKKYVGALKESLKKRKKVRTPESISGDIDRRTTELNQLQSEHSRVENELSALETELGKFGSLQEVNSVIQKLQSIEERISQLDTQLAKHKQNLKTADGKKNIYSKTYSQAVNDLPIAQEGKESARANLISLANKYTSERTATVTEALMQKKLGTLSDDDAKKMQENLHNIVELNKQLQNGTLTQEEYIKKVTDAYILMRKVSSDEAKTTAKADAEKLATAALLVKKYEEEEAILKRIIKTQKPKEPVIAQPDNVSNQSASNRKSEPAQSVGVVHGITGVVGSGNVGVGSVVLNAGGSGLATEDTVSKIYALLSTKRSETDGAQDSRIEAIKRAIATKEAEERAALEVTHKKAAEEKKAADEVKKKAIVEKKTTEEVKKKTSEEKKGVEQVKKKVAEEKKVVAEVKKQSTSIPKAPSKKVARETIQNLFASAHKSYGEIAASNKVFREHGFSVTDGIITQQTKGLMARVDELLKNGFDTHGHMHPRNSMYSATDLASMANIRAQNKSYNSDVLVTPSYIYKLEGLSKVSVEQLTKLHSLFNQFEASHMNATLLNKAKESLVYEFAQNNGISYSKNTYDASGKITDITNQEKMLQNESLELLKEFVSVLRNNKHNTAEEYSAWQNKKNALLDRMRKDEMLDSLMLSSAQDKEIERTRSSANYDKVRSGTLIQEAIDYDFDLSLFIQQFKDYFVAISKLGETVKPNSSLAKINQYIHELGKFEVNSNEYKDLLNNIKTLSLTVFDKNPDRQLDRRFLPQLASISANDKSGAIRKVLLQEKLKNALRDYTDENDLGFEHIPISFQEDIDDEPDKFAKMTLSELKAELSRLEGLRDEGSVDPRFATAEKQDVIIGLLKNGVAIAGKGANVSSASQKTTGEKKGLDRVSKGQTIDNARKEVDSTTGAASTTVKDTGEVITKTAQKCGAEILNITKTVKNGVESTTASINNDYEVAMKKTNEQIKAKGQRGLFGAPYNPNENIETTEAQAALNKYIETYNKLQGLISKFKSLNLSTDAGKNEASKLQVDIDIAQKDLDYFEDKLISVAANTEKFLGGKEAFAIMNTGALDQTGMSLKLLAQQSEKAMVAFNGLYNDGTKLLYDVFDPATSTFKRYSLEVDKATGYVRKMETAQTGLVNAFQNVNKVQRQSADLEGIDGINANSNLVKQYNQARQKLDQAVNDSWTKARDENRLISLDEQKEIYAMSNEVLRLGKRILSTANSFKIFKAEGGQTFEVVKGGAESLESAMRRLASEQALDDKMSIGNIAYNDATKKLSYDLTDLDGNIHKVTMSYVDMFNQVKVTSNNSVAAMDKVSAAIREDMVIIDDAVGAGLIDTRTDKYVEYTNELNAMFDYKEKLEASDDKLTQNDIDNLNMRKAAVKALGDELVATAKKNAISMGQGSKSVQNEVNKKNTVDVGVSNFSALSNTKQYKSYLTVYQAMIDKQEEFRQKGVLAGESEQNQLARMAKEVENARVKFEQLANASAQFNAKVGESGQVKILPKDFSYGNLEQEMKQFVLSQNDLTQSQKEMIEKTWSFKNAQDGATYSVRVGKDQMASMSVIFDEGTHRIGQYTVETKKYRTSMEKFMDSLKNKWQELARYLATFGSFYQVLNLLRQGITYVREIDSALTELKKVTDETEKSYDRFLDTAAKTADKVGSTIKEIVSSTADWARLGYSMEEATRLAESTSVLLNVSEFQSIEDATSALTSTLQAFGYTANQSMYVVDVMNEIGNNFAISSDGIATALQDSASSLMAANNSYEEAVALIAAANRVVQDPNSVGAALRTISLRLRGTSVKELEEAGEDTTGAVESTSKLRSKIKSLSGVDILTESGAYKDTYTILLEISKVWNSITDDKNRAALLELMAGKNRSNTLAAILSNTKDLEEAYASAMEAEGSAYEENEKYLDSIQGRIDLFTNAVQTMWSNALDDSLIKGIVDLGTELVKLIDKIGLIPSLLTAIGITKILPSLLKAITHTETFGGVLKTLAFGAQYANNSIGEIIISLSKMISTTVGGIPSMVKFGYQVQGMTGAMSQLGKGISMAWAAVPVVGKIMLVVAAISAVVAIVDSLTTSAKEAAKAAEEAVTAYQNATKTLKDHYATIEDIKDDYKDLSDGVDELGRNISLSTDEYKRYNEITNKIADMFPEMVSGYTEEGNAIIALKGNVDALTEAYEKEAQAARDAIIVKSNDIFGNFQNNTTKAQSWLGARAGLSKQHDLSDLGTLLFGTEDEKNKIIDANDSGVRKLLKDAGVEFTSFSGKTIDIINKNSKQLQSYYNILKSEIDAEVAPVKSLVNAYLGNDEDYQKLSDEGRKIAQTIISGFDTEFYARDEFENWTDVAAWIDTNVIQKLQNTGNLEEFNIAFDLQTRFNNGKVKVDDYIDQINEFIKLLEQLGFDNEIITTIKGVFKIDDYETQKQSAMEILDAEGDKSAGTLTKDDLDIIDKNKTKWKEELELDGKAEMSWEDLTKKIAEAKEMAWSASEEFDKISENIDSIQDAYSTLSDVVTEYNENGFLSLDNLQALLSLEPEYLACLQMENGQLSINQQALQSLIQARLAEAKATIVQSAMDQLHALAARTEEQAVTDSANAASNAVNGLGAYASALGTVAQDAIVAAGAVTAFNAAVEGAQNNKFVDQSEIDAIMSSMNTQLQMIDSVSANLKTNFNAITGLDKDDTSTGGSGKGDTALDRIKNKYEGKISNLENKQTYIENEIEKLEAEDEAVSKSYYEQQISLEEQKIDLLKQERNELQALYKANPAQETADALWEVEHVIQESTLRMVEFRQSIIDLYTTAFDKAITAYDNKDDFLSDQQNYIDKYRQLMEMNDSPLKASGYQEQLDAEWAKKNANIAKLALLEKIYADAMANGLKEGSEEWVDLQDKIRATEEAILDNNIAIEEYAEAMRQIPVEAFNSVREMFGYQTDFLTKQQDYVEGYADYLEAIGVDVPREVYDKLIEIEQEKRNNTLADLVDARQGLVDIEAQGFTAADEEWQDAYNKITDLEKAIQDSDIAMAQWEKTIRDMDFEKFERFTSRLDDLNSEIEHIKNLLDDEDVAFEDGTWTEEGITSLGLLYQQMKLAEQKSKEYADKIEELNETYQSGAMSEQEYYERLQELKEGQWGAIESYEDAKDAIVDMEEARIDMIEEGINEEIDAYKELIDLKKEELDAERDLYEFKKNIQKQTKDIASLERRIASMSGSTDAATIAERTKLQAQLREAQEGLDDTYYTHAKDAQSKALDDENEAYVTSKEDYLEMLRDTLDDTAAIINAKVSEFLLNADVGLEQLNGVSQEHGITLSDSLMQPWINASMVSDTFKQNTDLNLFSLINEDGVVTIFNTTATDAFNDAFGAGGSAATLFTTTVNTKISEIKFTVEQAKSPLTADLKYPWESTYSPDGPINTFSTNAQKAIGDAVEKAKDNAENMKTFLSSPWTGAGQAVNTFSKRVEDALNGAIRKAKEYANTINNLPAPNTPSYIGSGSGGDTGGGGGNGQGDYAPYQPPISPREDVKQLQQILNQFFSAKLALDGIYGSATKSAVANMQSWLSITPSGKYDKKTKDAMEKWLNQRPVSSWFRQVGFGVPAAMYAKGTIGTKRDELAITDESWIGEEITLAAGKNGQLQYLKKGSAVLPSDIANNLVEWGKINPDMSAFSNGLQGMNVMTSVLNKPELNLEFGSLLHIDNCSNEVIPEVKKMVTEALDKFSRQLNYSLRRVGAK